MNLRRILMVLMVSAVVTTGCNEKKATHTDTLTSGNLELAADESFRPIIEEQIKVFDSSYPKANVSAVYQSEASCIKSFLNDTTKFMLVTRELTKEEKEHLAAKKVVTTSLDIAKDAVAIIVNNNAEDSVFSIDQLKGILTGDHVKPYTVVFDNQGSSTLRYMIDSLIPGEKLREDIYAAKGNDSVINYVSNNPNAIGFIGVSNVSDYEDPEGLAFIKSVKVAGIYNDSLDKVYKPYQAYIAAGQYPLTRKLFFVHKETYGGLGTGFALFLKKDRGQLIFKQARLFPTRVNVVFRPAEMNNK